AADAVLGTGGSPEEVRANAAEAFATAARLAVKDAARAGVLLAIDDADRMDNASRFALMEGVALLAGAGFSSITTSEAPLPFPEERVPRRALSGLSPAHAAALLERIGGEPGVLPPSGDVEPLYVELLHRWKLDGPGARAPGRLFDLVAAGLRGLSAAQL